MSVPRKPVAKKHLKVIEASVLDDAMREAIEVAQYPIHQAYYSKLGPLRVSPIAFIRAGLSMFGDPEALPPKRPVLVCNILASYARELFSSELGQWERSDRRPNRSDIAKRVEQLVIDNVNYLSRAPVGGSLTAHVSESKMRQSVRDALGPFIDSPSDWKPRTARAIRELRNELGWTQEELAERLEISDRTVLRHENAQTHLSPKLLRVYERLFSKELKRQVKLGRSVT